MNRRGVNRRNCVHQGNDKIDKHGLPIPSKVKDAEEFMRLINSYFPRIPSNIKDIPELNGFLEHFRAGGTDLKTAGVGLEKFGEVMDFFEKVMPDEETANRVIKRFVQVTAKQLHKSVPSTTLEIMGRVTRMALI